VGARDRKYQIWERNPLSVPLWSESVLKQKLEYLHNNPVRAGLCTLPEQYKYSTASIYNSGEDIFGFVTPIYL
jgi:putative transposase